MSVAYELRLSVTIYSTFAVTESGFSSDADSRTLVRPCSCGQGSASKGSSHGRECVSNGWVIPDVNKVPVLVKIAYFLGSWGSRMATST